MKNRLVVAAVLLLGLAATARAQVVFDSGPGASGNAYQLVQDNGISWAAARTASLDLTFPGCAAGHLVTISSQEENDFVEDLLPDAGFQEAWIGLYESDPGPPRVFSWVTGEPVGFVTWSPGEPSGDAPEVGMWAAAGLGTEGTWNDESDPGRVGGYVVEHECGVAAPTAGAGALTALGILLLVSACWFFRRRSAAA